ncbi:MAG TPA: MFS transporter [Spirochaetia bacterium]|nr:MFS transporter [Spirochaetia bacterium]
MDTSSRRLYFVLLAGFVLFGVIFTIAGAALPHIISAFGWSYTETGLVLAASAAGYFLSSFVNGLLAQRVPAKAIMLCGLAVGVATMALFMRWPSPWLNLVLNFGIGLSNGGLEVVTNLEVIHLEQKGQSRLMNLMHAAFCVGAILGPTAVGLILQAGVPLVAIFVTSAALFALLGVLVAVTKFPAPRAASVHEGRSGLSLLKEPLVLLMTLALLVYVGTEMGISSWASEYVSKVIGVAASTAAFAVAIFWVGLLAGRLVISFFYTGTRQDRLMLGLSVLSAVALVGILVARSVPTVAVAIFLAGLGCSGFYPLGMSLLGTRFKSGVAVGTAATGGGAGSVAFPFLMALLSQSVGIRNGFWFYLGMSLLLVVISVLLMPVVRRTPASKDP